MAREVGEKGDSVERRDKRNRNGVEVERRKKNKTRRE